jgi:hypothetical protein
MTMINNNNGKKMAISASNICFSNGQTLQELFDNGKLLTTKTVVQKEVLQKEVLDARYNTIVAQNEEKINALVEKINRYDSKISEMNKRIDEEYKRIQAYFTEKNSQHEANIRQSSGYFMSNLRDVKEQMTNQNRDFYENKVAEIKELLNSQKQEVSNLTNSLRRDVNQVAAELRESVKRVNTNMDNMAQELHNTVNEVNNGIDSLAKETKDNVMKDLLQVERSFQKDVDKELEYIKDYLIFLEDEIKFANELQEKVEPILNPKTPKEQIENVVEAIKEVIDPQPEKKFFEEDGTPKKELFRFISTYEEPVVDENGFEMIDVDLTFSTNGKYKTSYKYALQDGVIQRIKYQIKQ